MTTIIFRLAILFIALSTTACNQTETNSETAAVIDSLLIIKSDDAGGTISIYRSKSEQPILVQNAKPGFRPYIHPIAAPDGIGVLTEYSPGHHKHQTGLYWGFTRVNGRDFFHNPGEEYWKKISAFVVQDTGREVKWQTVYDLLDEQGNAILTETQNWTAKVDSGRYFLTLEWKGEAKKDVTIGKYDYGGLFLRMPWKEGIKGQVVNAVRQRNQGAEGNRAMWADVGMQLDGRQDQAHVAIFDHPENKGYPQHWRVDGQLGVGPAPTRKEDLNIRKGEVQTFRHQLMVYTGNMSDAIIDEHWGAFSGRNSMYAKTEMWAIAQAEGYGAKFLTPEEAVKAMSIKDGYNVNVWAAEPLMTQPMAFCWDDRGRMWIAENKDYESRGHGFSNAGTSRILILEDTNRDGTADTRKVFMEGLAFPAALAVGFDGVFVGAPPNLLFIPDRNHDDKADVNDIEVRLTGWGIRDRHETLNSFHWGPDGWLYGCQGFATPSKVRKPIGKGKLYRHRDKFPEDILEGEGTDINGGVWRYHPTKDKFEVVAHGLSNPWGIDYDAQGQLFISACVLPHLWHIVPGGIYHRQGGQHFNPYVYDDIKTITDHTHRSAHGGARIYQSDAFPASEKGRMFMANIHEHAVLSDVLTPKGSGFVGTHADDFLMANNAQWVGFSMEVGPDGNLYVLDWHDADICGTKVMNTETGRIFRIHPQTSAAKDFAKRYSDLNKLPDAELVQLQTSPSDWHTRRARVILQSRAAQGKLQGDTYTRLAAMFNSTAATPVRLKALWTMHITKTLPADVLVKALEDKNEHIRAWAIQLLCEDGTPGAAAMQKFADMAVRDQSAVVRLHLASAVQRIDKNSAWNVVEGLAKHGEDANDHNLPKMIWYGLEKLFADNTGRALKLASDTKIPMLAQFTARRAVDGGALNELVTAIDAQPANTTYLLEGMMNGMDGRVDVKAPASWSRVYTTLRNKGGKNAQLAEDIAATFGDTEAARRSLAIVENKSAPIEQRRKALVALAAQQRRELQVKLAALFSESALKLDVIRAIAAFDDRELGVMLLKSYPKMNDEEKAVAIQTLASRPTYGWLLTTALKDKSIARKEVTPNTARQLRRVVGSGFVEVWGPIDDKPRDNKEFDKYKKLMAGEVAKTANVDRGRQIFMNTCGPCHKMFGQGGNIGPDLTGSNRSNLDYLLFNILTPSAEIQDDYKMMVVTTRDGRTYTGNLVSENQRQITMRVVGQNDVLLNKSSIQSREVTEQSMMPQGLLSNLSQQEVVDLLMYLQRGVR